MTEKEQLKCQICDSLRKLTEEEITESINMLKIRNLKPDQILNIWSAYDGDTCPEGENHNYEWNPTFREYIMDRADIRRKAELDIVKYNNECEELARTAEKLEADVAQNIREIIEIKDAKIKQMYDKIAEKENAISELENTNPILEEEILKTSGRDWKGWL